MIERKKTIRAISLFFDIHMSSVEQNEQWHHQSLWLSE